MEAVTHLDALAGGLMAVATPGMMVVLPVYVAFVVGSLFEDVADSSRFLRRDLFLTCFFFALGFAVMLMTLLLAGGVQEKGVVQAARLLAGGVVLLWGMKLAGGYRISLAPRRGAVMDDWPLAAIAAMLMGACLAWAWTPSGPVMGAILALGMSKATAHLASGLMAVYMLMLGLWLLALGMLTHPFMRWLVKSPAAARWVEGLAGFVLTVTGFLLAADVFSLLSETVARAWPWLNRVG